MARLILNNVTKDFAGFKALDNVSLDIADGEFVAILGPSGCGKTTLLRLVAGFDQVTDGSIAIGPDVVSSRNIHLPTEQRRIGLVFQSYALWPHLTVEENVSYALNVARIPRDERERRVAAALEIVGLTGFGARRPAILSGGQRQRVALARCLVMEPALVLLDEPLANLDAHLRAAMEDEFASFHRRTGTTMVYITHDQAEAMALADRIAVMDKGRVLQLATPSMLYREPASPMVASFIGAGMVMPCEVLTAEEGGRAWVSLFGYRFQARCRQDQRPVSGQPLCLRSANLSFETGGEGLEGTVRRMVYQGGYFRVEVQVTAAPNMTLALDVPEPTALTPGSTIYISITDGWVVPEVDI